MNSIIIQDLGICQYEDTWRKMQMFTKQRAIDTRDELWQLEHYPVFTLGQAGSEKHILEQGNIPVVYSDRGGQVTYHGPGQLVIYLLIDLRRKKLALRQVLHSLQQAVIDLLATYNINATLDPDHPGVYVENTKICSIGLKVHKGCVYHGLSLNINMDLEPFTRINPCGQENLRVTQLIDLGIKADLKVIASILTGKLIGYLGYSDIV